MVPGYFVVPRPNGLGLKQQDWILMADIENYTGDKAAYNEVGDLEQSNSIRAEILEIWKDADAELIEKEFN